MNPSQFLDDSLSSEVDHLPLSHRLAHYMKKYEKLPMAQLHEILKKHFTQGQIIAAYILYLEIR